MKKLLFIPAVVLAIIFSCKKDRNKEIIVDGVNQKIETENGITYQLFAANGVTAFKGILVLGSGNDENHPTEGLIDGAAETALCQKAAKNGYAAAIVKYRKTPGTADWNISAQMIGEDFDKCITAIADKYSLDKSKAVVGGFSYASYALLTAIAYFDNLNYCKGLLAACGSTDIDKISKFKIPVFSLTGKDMYEAYTDEANPQNNAYAGVGLYDKIPANSPIKAKSKGFNDPNSEGHCNGDWTEEMYNSMVFWMQ